MMCCVEDDPERVWMIKGLYLAAGAKLFGPQGRSFLDGGSFLNKKVKYMTLSNKHPMQGSRCRVGPFSRKMEVTPGLVQYMLNLLSPVRSVSAEMIEVLNK